MFPMSVEALDRQVAGQAGREGPQQEAEESRPVRSRVARHCRACGRFSASAPPSRSIWSLTRLRIRIITREIPFWGIAGLMVAFAINNGYFAGRVGGVDVWPVTYLMLQAVEGSATLFFSSSPPCTLRN
jgi:ABC-2 type transport system permease protein